MSGGKMPLSHASINNYNWIGAIVRNSYDAFYGTSITAYEENTTANLVVSVSNDYHNAQLNVSAVTVGFDWGTNYTSTECSINNPFVVPSLESQVFSIDFTVPSALFVSNLVVHSYTIYVEHVNSTSGNKAVVGGWTVTGDSFAIFSSDQKDAYTYQQEVSAYPSTPIGGVPFLTAEARELLVESSVTKSLASDSYMRGDFASAKQYYLNSLNFIEQAYSNETDKWSAFENAFVNILNGGSTLLAFQGYAWLLFGIGFLFMGIGVLIYLARKKPQSKTNLPPS